MHSFALHMYTHDVAKLIYLQECRRVVNGMIAEWRMPMKSHILKFSLFFFQWLQLCKEVF